MSDKYRQFIEDLYNGMVAFFPDDMFGQKSGRDYKIERSFRDSSGRNWNKEDFTVYVLNWTGSHSTDEAAEKIKKWKKIVDSNQEPTSDMPPQEILEEAKKIEETAAPPEVKKEIEKKELLKLSQKYAEEQIVPAAQEGPEGLFKISPDTFQELVGKTSGVAFQFGTFFTTPKKLAAENPQAVAALSQSVSLNQLEKQIKILTPQQKELLNLLRQAEFSFYAQTRLQRTIIPIDQITVLIQHVPQSQVSLFIHPFEKSSSLIGGLAQNIAGSVAKKAISKVASKTITSALTKAGISITTKAATGALAGAAFGAVGGPLAIITTIIGAITPFIKDGISRIKRNGGKILIGIGAFLFGTGFLLQGTIFGSPLIISGLAAGAGGVIIQAGGAGSALSGIGGAASSFITGLSSIVVASLAGPIIISLIAIPAIIAIILFIINSGAYVVPSNMGVGARYGPHDCSIETKIIERAQSINKNLLLGFNNYYNKSPDYPELWNAQLFATNPNPEDQNSIIDMDDMFWCNYTPLKSYLAINLELPFRLTSMMNYFISQGKWNSGEMATTEDLCPGDVIFFKSPPEAQLLSHVAVVETVTEDEITTVQSNSPWKKMNYFTDSSGHFPIYGKGSGRIKIVGFGSP